MSVVRAGFKIVDMLPNRYLARYALWTNNRYFEEIIKYSEIL
jgi:hypothetical protein